MVLGISLLCAYLWTLAPGLTWANHGTDGGDLIAAAATGGIPHPTGYPLYLLLARLFQFLPVGTLAYRTNLMSALFTVLAAVLVYQTVIRHLSSAGIIPSVLAGLAAGFSFGLAPLVWSQAVITEIYGLQAFLVMWVIYLYTTPVPDSHPGQKLLHRWRGLSLGLALANHMTSLFLVPVALLLGSTRKLDSLPPYHQLPWFKEYRFDLASLGRQLLWLVIGLGLYLVLPLRAFTDPPINWGNPASLDRLWWMISGELYQSYVTAGIFPLRGQLQGWMDFTLVQMGSVSLLLGLYGLAAFGKFSHLTLLTVWTAITSLFFASVYHPVDGSVYLIPLLISLSIWLGLGTGMIAQTLAGHSHALAFGSATLILLTILLRPISYFHQVDASQDPRAESFGREVLSTVPEHAVLFTEGDQALFSLWYFHFALHQRTDVAVLSKELLSYDWYREMVGSAYPSLSLPGSPMFMETIIRTNPQRPACDIQYNGRAEIECTKPLAADP